MEKQKKKRGRKPKIKNNKPQNKKRGRKPKGGKIIKKNISYEKKNEKTGIWARKGEIIGAFF